MEGRGGMGRGRERGREKLEMRRKEREVGREYLKAGITGGY